MAEKKPFVLRLQPEMLKALEKWAADDFRSVNGQIERLCMKADDRKRKKAGESSSAFFANHFV